MNVYISSVFEFNRKKFKIYLNYYQH